MRQFLKLNFNSISSLNMIRYLEVSPNFTQFFWVYFAHCQGSVSLNDCTRADSRSRMHNIESVGSPHGVNNTRVNNDLLCAEGSRKEGVKKIQR